MSSTQLTTVPQSTALVESAWTKDQIDLLKRTIAKGTTDDELKLFLHVVKRTGLDPFARQIYAVKRKNYQTGQENMVIQTGIDGLRLTASRTNVYAGRDEAAFEYDSKGAPTKAKVTVYKIVQGLRCAFTATAKWDEYYPGEKMGFMWQKLPETMLEKCAESKALRMAFPAELSGVYSNDEMEQAEKPRIAPDQPGPEDGNTEPQHYKIPFGKFAQRTLEEVEIPQLISYIEYLEAQPAKSGKALSDAALDFISRAEKHIAAIENANFDGEQK